MKAFIQSYDCNYEHEHGFRLNPMKETIDFVSTDKDRNVFHLKIEKSLGWNRLFSEEELRGEFEMEITIKPAPVKPKEVKFS
jgi:hypothetical protein